MPHRSGTRKVCGRIGISFSKHMLPTKSTSAAAGVVRSKTGDARWRNCSGAPTTTRSGRRRLLAPAPLTSRSGTASCRAATAHAPPGAHYSVLLRTRTSSLSTDDTTLPALRGAFAQGASVLVLVSSPIQVSLVLRGSGLRVTVCDLGAANDSSFSLASCASGRFGFRRRAIRHHRTRARPTGNLPSPYIDHVRTHVAGCLRLR